MKVLIIGYACIPNRGGETSNAWNWASCLSRYHDVWVLACPGDHLIAESFLAEFPNAHLILHWVAVPPLFDQQNHRRSKIDLAMHYIRWLRLAYNRAIKLHEQIGFDIIHHVSFGTVSAPPPFWKLPVPFVWGPVGGAQRAPSEFRDYLCSWSLFEIIRDIRVALLPLSVSLRRTAKSSAVILATNRETYGLLTKVGARNVRLFLDSGIPTGFVSGLRVSRATSGPFTLLWVGCMQARKALPLALEALADTTDLNVRLLIAGRGEMREAWERYAKSLNLGSRAEFVGQVPWNEMPHLYQRADAFLFTSLRDSFGTQVLEAMGHGLPILALDHQGVGTFVPSEAGIKVPVTNPTETVNGIAAGIRRLALFPEERRKMGEAARAYAQTQTWERRAERISQLYKEVLSRSSLWATQAGSPSPIPSDSNPDSIRETPAPDRWQGCG